MSRYACCPPEPPTGCWYRGRAKKPTSRISRTCPDWIRSPWGGKSPTRGNALETASWSQAEQVRTLLVVTAWFHMPRALVELRRAMPALTLLPYPVGQLRSDELIHAGGVRRLIGEYHKYLAALSGLTAAPMLVAALGSEPVR
jgi:hypothetical protein